MPRKGSQLERRRTLARVLRESNLHTAAEWVAEAESVGWVYFIQAGKYIKIGYTSRPDVAERLAALQTANPVELRLLAAVPGDPTLERLLHRLFGNYRVRGEWFRACAPGLKQVIDRASTALFV